MSKVVAAREGTGSSVRTQYAQRADGAWFTRIQDRHPLYGYRWTAWRACPYTPSEGTMDSDFGEVSYGSTPIEPLPRWRLPT